MLDDYQNSQKIAYKILTNAISKNEISHAYLFDVGDFSDGLNLVMAFVKTILCPNNYTNKKQCDKCNKCEMINGGNHPEVKIIGPDGVWIKKDQLKELMEEFNKKAVIGDKKIYIINEPEKLNTQAANSMLKFLEEPEEGIIALLVTKNIYNVLETIRSRCQIISLKEDQNKIGNKGTIEEVKEFLNIDDEEKIIKIINFVNYYEKNHFDTIIYMQKLWHDYIKTREELLMGFDLLTIYYKDVLNYLLNQKLQFFDEYIDDIKEIADKNEVLDITKKINLIMNLKTRIKYNVNINLIMDKLIIEMEGGL